MDHPNFLIIGAAKAGTTALYHWCRQHPDVFMPSMKEPRFFAFEGEHIAPEDPVNQGVITDAASYRALFEPAESERAVGEASAMYLADASAPGRIAHYVPEAKFIAVLRDPVERAYSHFLFARRTGFEPADATFEDAIENETVRVGGWLRHRPYVRHGFYGEQLARYYERFDREQTGVFLFRSLKQDPEAFAQSVYRFLEVDDTYRPETGERYARSGVPRSNTLHALLNRFDLLRKLAKKVLPVEAARRWRRRLTNRNLKKPEMPEGPRRRLRRLYREDIERLQTLIDRDLTAWL